MLEDGPCSLPPGHGSQHAADLLHPQDLRTENKAMYEAPEADAADAADAWNHHLGASDSI